MFPSHAGGTKESAYALIAGIIAFASGITMLVFANTDQYRERCCNRRDNIEICHTNTTNHTQTCTSQHERCHTKKESSGAYLSCKNILGKTYKPDNSFTGGGTALLILGIVITTGGVCYGIAGGGGITGYIKL